MRVHESLLMRFFVISFFVFYALIRVDCQESEWIIHQFEIEADVKSVACSPDGQLLAVGASDKSLYLYDANTFDLLETKGGYYHDVTCLAFSSDNLHLYAGSADRAIRRYTIGQKKYQTFRGHATLIWSLALSPDDKLLLAGTLEDRTRIWDVDQERVVHELAGHERSESVMAVAFSPNGDYIATGSADKTIKIWDASSYTLLNTLNGHGDVVFDLKFTPDSRYLVSASRDQTIRLWNVMRGELVRIMQQHHEDVVSLAVSPDGRYCLSASLDKTIVMWNLTDGKPLYTFTQHENLVNQLAYSPDGDYFYSAADGGACWVWKVSDRIFVDAYLKDSLDTMVAQEFLFEPRRENEKRTEYREREVRQESRLAELYRELYKHYLRRGKEVSYEDKVESKVNIYYD